MPNRIIDIRIAVVQIGGRWRAATKLAGKAVYGAPQGDEGAAVRSLLAYMAQDGPLAGEISLALDLELMGQTEESLLGDGKSKG